MQHDRHVVLAALQPVGGVHRDRPAAVRRARPDRRGLVAVGGADRDPVGRDRAGRPVARSPRPRPRCSSRTASRAAAARPRRRCARCAGRAARSSAQPDAAASSSDPVVRRGRRMPVDAEAQPPVAGPGAGAERGERVERLARPPARPRRAAATTPAAGAPAGPGCAAAAPRPRSASGPRSGRPPVAVHDRERVELAGVADEQRPLEQRRRRAAARPSASGTPRRRSPTARCRPSTQAHLAAVRDAPRPGRPGRRARRADRDVGQRQRCRPAARSRSPTAGRPSAPGAAAASRVDQVVDLLVGLRDDHQRLAGRGELAGGPHHQRGLAGARRRVHHHAAVAPAAGRPGRVMTAAPPLGQPCSAVGSRQRSRPRPRRRRPRVGAARTPPAGRRGSTVSARGREAPAERLEVVGQRAVRDRARPARAPSRGGRSVPPIPPVSSRTTSVRRR